MQIKNKRIKSLIIALAVCSFWGNCQHFASAEPQLLTLPVGAFDMGEAIDIDYLWDDGWFLGDNSGYVYNHDLARVAGAIMLTTYQQPRGQLTDLLAALGFEEDSVRDYHYQPVEPEYPDKSAYSFAIKKLGQDGQTVPLVLAAIRGTSGQQEWLSNLNISDTTRKKERYHEGFEKSARLIANDLAAYFQEMSVEPEEARVLIVGHSRGAAVANLVGAFLDRGEWGLEAEVPAKQIYDYAFATPNSCTDIAERKAGLYRNIFNIDNPEDLITELPFRGGSWDYGPYGVVLQLPTADKLKGQPERYEKLLARMKQPFAQLTGGEDFQPVRKSEYPARSVKNLQWLVGSVERFYRRGDRLGHKAMERGIRKNIPVGDMAAAESWEQSVVPVKMKDDVKRLEYAHAAVTYNVWLLSGEAEDIYMRGTPTEVRILAETVDGNKLPVTLLAEGVPFAAQISVPGGETVAAVYERGGQQVMGELDPELRTAGGHAASFVIPEGERLQVTLTATEGDTDFLLTTRLEPNEENGLAADTGYISEQRFLLPQGESCSFLIRNREIEKIMG